MATLRISAPLPGWCLPLAEVPDPVFAEGMAGDGIAVEPTEGMLTAPCDGEIVPMRGARHAITLRAQGGIEVMVHIGIETVALGGEGFEVLVAAGQRVRAGEPLIRFDMDALAARAKSLATPVILPGGGEIVRRAPAGRLRRGDLLMEVRTGAGAAAKAEHAGESAEARCRIPFEHGLHVRPAATIAAAVKPFKADTYLRLHDRSATARSPVAMMALGARCGDEVTVSARGPDARSAVAALAQLLGVVSETRAMPPPKPPPLDRRRIEASIASRGVAIGPAVHWAQAEIAVAERGAGEAAERAALDRARAAVREHLKVSAASAGAAHRAVLEAHAELLEDPELETRAAGALARGASAGYAWRQATRSIVASLESLQDERMRERVADLRDLEAQVLRVLGGKPPESRQQFPAGSIVLADDLLPSHMAVLERARVAGFCTARGGPTSHVAILAAAMALPGLVAAGADVLRIEEGTPVALDAEHGWIDIDPPASERASTERAVAERAVERADDLAAAQSPASTRDGVRITVLANLGCAADAAQAVIQGADGCGLLRTEFLFLDRREPPDEDTQAAEYRRIALALKGRPLAIRTLDVGGDKPIAYLPMPREDNPALGLRGVRATLRDPHLLRTQLAAILRAAAAGPCRILVPMVTDREEIDAVRAILAELARERRLEAPPLGAMIETPASALLAEQLAAACDFLSIGTNDLSQYVLAIDRGHPELARRLDALHPAVLRLVAQVTQGAQAHGKPVSVCGALGGDVDALPLLVGLGVHEVSATPSMVPRLKRTVRGLDAAECRELAARALQQESAAAVRELAAVARARARAALTTGGER